MIAVRLAGGVRAYVSDGVWTCSDDKVLKALRSMPMMTVGYYIDEDDQLAANAVLLYGGERLRATPIVVRTDAPPGAVY